MSELESHKMVDEKYCTDCVCVISSEVYIKSEADKVIADLEDRLQAANEQVENLINSASSIMLSQDKVNDNKCKELRYQKYMRCLNNAWWCLREEFYAEDCHCERWVDWAIKWYNRWLELAEKFNDVK